MLLVLINETSSDWFDLIDLSHIRVSIRFSFNRIGSNRNNRVGLEIESAKLTIFAKVKNQNKRIDLSWLVEFGFFLDLSLFDWEPNQDLGQTEMGE